MVRWLLLALAGLLVGCQSAFVKSTPNENSPYFEVPIGSSFVLRSELLVPPHTDRLYFQDGDLPFWYDVNKYRPYCVLQLGAARNHEEVIKPDKFVVTKNSTAHFFQLIEAPTPDRLADATDAVPLLVDRESSDDNGYEVFGSVMKLHSDRQPYVTQLTCADWGLPQPGMHISVRKIRRALGNYFRLDIASK